MIFWASHYKYLLLLLLLLLLLSPPTTTGGDEQQPTNTNNTSSIEPAATQPVTCCRAGNVVIHPHVINNVPNNVSMNLDYYDDDVAAVNTIDRHGGGLHHHLNNINISFTCANLVDTNMNTNNINTNSVSNSAVDVARLISQEVQRQLANHRQAPVAAGPDHLGLGAGNLVELSGVSRYTSCPMPSSVLLGPADSLSLLPTIPKAAVDKIRSDEFVNFDTLLPNHTPVNHGEYTFKLVEGPSPSVSLVPKH